MGQVSRRVGLINDSAGTKEGFQSENITLADKPGILGGKSPSTPSNYRILADLPMEKSNSMTTRMKLIGSFVVLCLCTLTASIVYLVMSTSSSAAHSDSTPPPPPNATDYPNAFNILPPQGTPNSFSIVSYNDVYVGAPHLSPTGQEVGGASRFQTIVKTWRDATPHGLLLFAGDTLSPSLESKVDRGLQMIKIHNRLGLDAACLGNHEFDFGIEGFLNASRHSNFPWLNANCYETSTNKLLRDTTPHLIKEINGLTIGIFGVLYDLEDPNLGLYFESPIKAATKQVEKLRSKGVDIIIALTHQNWQDDNVFSKTVQGVDLMVGGHDHDAMMQTQFGIPYIKADSDFETIWLTSIIAKKTMQHHLIDITSEIEPSTEMDEFLAEQQTQLDKVYGQTIGSTCEDLDLREQVVRFQEAAIGNFMADAQLKYSTPPADIAIMNGGGIRSDRIFRQTNELKMGDVVGWTPFGNPVFSIRLSGKQLLKYMTSELSESCGTRGAIRSNGELLHPAGFTYKFKCTGLAQGELYSLMRTDESDIHETDQLILALNEYSYDRLVDILDREIDVLTPPKGRITVDDAMINVVRDENILCPRLENRFVISI